LRRILFTGGAGFIGSCTYVSEADQAKVASEELSDKEVMQITKDSKIYIYFCNDNNISEKRKRKNLM